MELKYGNRKFRLHPIIKSDLTQGAVSFEGAFHQPITPKRTRTTGTPAL